MYEVCARHRACHEFSCTRRHTHSVSSGPLQDDHACVRDTKVCTDIVSETPKYSQHCVGDTKMQSTIVSETPQSAVNNRVRDTTKYNLKLCQGHQSMQEDSEHMLKFQLCPGTSFGPPRPGESGGSFLVSFYLHSWLYFSPYVNMLRDAVQHAHGNGTTVL